MKKGLDINWDKVEFLSFDNIASPFIEVLFHDEDDFLYLDMYLLAAFDEMLEREINGLKKVHNRFYTWNDETGWYFDKDKLNKEEREIFKN